MDIEVRLFSLLSKYLPDDATGRSVRLTVPDGATVSQVMEQMGVPMGLTKLIFIDSVHSKPDTVLHDGNVLSVFPPIAGGS